MHVTCTQMACFCPPSLPAAAFHSNPVSFQSGRKGDWQADWKTYFKFVTGYNF